jgi:hypothetical protein
MQFTMEFYRGAEVIVHTLNILLNGEMCITDCYETGLYI